MELWEHAPTPTVLVGTVEEVPLGPNETLPSSQVETHVDPKVKGRLHFSVRVEQAPIERYYLPLLPALSLPYGWLTAREIPPSTLDGFESTIGGRFHATVTLTFPSGEQLTVVHTLHGVSPLDPLRLTFNVTVVNATGLPEDTPLQPPATQNLMLEESQAGLLEGSGQAEGVQIRLTIHYDPYDPQASRPPLVLTLELESSETDPSGTNLTFVTRNAVKKYLFHFLSFFSHGSLFFVLLITEAQVLILRRD